MKVRVSNGVYNEEKTVRAFYTEAPDRAASFAMELLEKWGLVAAMPDGEDSSGRAKMRLPTTQELVTRSFDIAEAAMAEARTRGMMVDLPDLNQINEKWDAVQQAKIEKRLSEGRTDA